MANYTLTVRYIGLEMFEQYALLYTCKSHPKYLHSFIIYILNYLLLIFDKQNLYANGPRVI